MVHIGRRLTALAVLLAAGALHAGETANNLLPADRPVDQVIDHYVGASLQSAKIRPAAQADDAELLRRLTLDLAGRIPTPGEISAYLADTNPDKKTKLVDRLMAAPAFVRHQSLEFATLLQADVQGAARKGQNKGALRDYLQTAFAENRSWDRIFREVMLPNDADPKTQGAGEFLRSRIKDLNRLTIDVSTLFFGVNISCAQCHDHPHVEDWKQDHFYGMKSFFSRTFEKGGILAEKDTGAVKFIPNKGQEKQAKVMFLTSKEVDVPAGKAGPDFNLRARFVDVALEPGQHNFFARSIANRLWHRFFGRGLVTPLDQMHSENPPSHPELLQWLARDVAEHGYDLRRLVRGLVLSEAYARTSRWQGEDAPSEKSFAVAKIRPLTPMQMAVSLRLATTDPDKLPSNGGDMEGRLESLEKAAKGLANLFVQPGDNFQVGVSEAMLFANNEGLLKELLTDAPGTLISRLKQVPDVDKRAELAVRSVLSRPAGAEEIRAMAEYMRRRDDRPVEACRQVVWALLTSAEFRFNH